jgi:hypothetical protein
MKELMGWVEAPDNDDWGEDYLFVNPYTKRKVRCTNNVINRPIYMTNVDTIKRDVLNRYIRYNGEPFIIGVTGMVLNGQHTMTACIFAEHERTGPDKAHWLEIWGDKPITLDKDVTYGISEDDDTVNTIDTAKSRSFGDVLYRDELFRKEPPVQRKKLAIACMNAVKTLWMRTGGEGGGWFGKRKGKHTIAEMRDYLKRHSTLEVCVKHIIQENVKDNISKYVTLGAAASLMYLMAATDTESEDYHLMTSKSEDKVNFDQMENAKVFWVKLANAGLPDFQELRYALSALNDETTGGRGNREEVYAVLALAWDLYLDGKPLTATACTLKRTEPDNHGNTFIAEWPNFGGIDMGHEAEVQFRGENNQEDEEPTDTPGTDAEPPPNDKPKRQVNKGPNKDGILKQLTALRKTNPDRILMIRAEGAWVLWEVDAEAYSKATGEKFVQKAGLICASFPPEKLEVVATKMIAAGHKLAQCYPGQTAKDWTVTDFVLKSPATMPTPPATPTSPVKPGGGAKPDTANKPAGDKPVSPNGNDGKPTKPSTKPGIKPGSLRGGTNG